MSENKTYNKVFKLVLGGILFGWLVKAPVFFWTYLNSVTINYPVTFELFPSIFENPALGKIMYFLPVATIPAVFLKNENISLVYHKTCSALLILASLYMMLNSATYNDATFVTSFWVSIWLFWFSFHPEKEHHKYACSLALAVVCMIFLGGVIGKMSQSWWNGEALYGIMESSFNHIPFTWLKNNLTFEQLELLALILSWGIIIIEIAITSSFFWPQKISLKFIPFIILGITLFRTWTILSVISCLVILLFACYKLIQATENEHCHESTEGN